MSSSSPAPWLAELRAHPARHDLLAAYSLLRSLSPAPRNDLSESTDDLPPDPVRFSHSADMALPIGELLAIEIDPDDPTRHLVTTAGPGPLGPGSPLPLALADDLDNPLAHAVLDLFHHRRTLLLCRGLLAADLPGTLDGEDPWSRRILALVGLADRTRTPLTALRLAPIFAVPDRSPRALALALARLLPDLFTAPFTLRCEPISDRWTALPCDQHSRLGRTSARLGDTAALGVAVRLPGTAARLTLGPLPASALDVLRPGGPAHTQLCALLADFIAEPLDLELILELEDMSLPPGRLGQRTLGRDLWLTPDPAIRRPRHVALPLRPATTHG
ncbi:MAG TPA: type VI secretion system baseplate subunit TssG [Nannocystis sp.]